MSDSLISRRDWLGASLISAAAGGLSSSSPLNAAEKSDADAQLNLGFFYVGMSFQDTKTAAERGDADAQVSLGFCYYFGKGVKQDDAEALKWYRKAAEQGHTTGQINLGNRYANGEGVEKDYAEAVKWLRKAA